MSLASVMSYLSHTGAKVNDECMVSTAAIDGTILLVSEEVELLTMGKDALTILTNGELEVFECDVGTLSSSSLIINNGIETNRYADKNILFSSKCQLPSKACTSEFFDLLAAAFTRDRMIIASQNIAMPLKYPLMKTANDERMLQGKQLPSESILIC